MLILSVFILEIGNNKINWSQEKGTKVADVLTMEYMSSDESEMDEKTHGHGVKQYNLRNFTWESGDLKRAKRKLDKSHQDSRLGQ